MTILKRLWDEHPQLTSFVILAAGMLIILFFSARHIGFDAMQWLVLSIATIVLAALCVWIIGWDVGEDSESGE